MTHEISILYTFSRNQANLFDSKANTLRLLLLNARKWSALQSLRMISITRKGERRERGGGRTRGRMDGSADSNSVRQDRENRKGGERDALAGGEFRESKPKGNGDRLCVSSMIAIIQFAYGTWRGLVGED